VIQEHRNKSLVELGERETLQQYFASCLSLVAGIILFGGLITPIVRLFIYLLVFHTFSHHVKLKRMFCKNLKPTQSKIKHL
jgi:hypothetical protein